MARCGAAPTSSPARWPGCGVGRGDRVATLGWNHVRHLEAYFGVPLMGGVLHTLNPRLSAAELAYVMNHAGDSVLLVDDVLLPVLERLRGQVSLKHVVVWTNGTQAPEGMIDYEELIAPEPEEFAGPRLDEREAACMCYTSGTTGRPKGVVYSHRAIVLHSLASAMTDGLAIGQREVLCPVVPMFHVNGWGLPFTATMVGCKQVLPGPHLDPESLLDLYVQEGVTLSAGVPTIWLGILQALETEPDRWKLGAIRMVVGGSAAPESMIRGFDRHGLRVVHAWGMTEMTPLGTVSWLKRSLEELSGGPAVCLPREAGTACSVRRDADHGTDGRGAVGWRGHGRAGGTRPVGSLGLLPGARAHRQMVR